MYGCAAALYSMMDYGTVLVKRYNMWQSSRSVCCIKRDGFELAGIAASGCLANNEKRPKRVSHTATDMV